MQEVGDVTPGLCSLHIPMALTASGLPESRPPGVHTASLSREKEDAHWLNKYPGIALPLVFRSPHSWTQLSQDGWNMEKEKKQNNPQQPNTLAVAHVDSACQFSQSRFPTQITDCWIWRTPCVCVHTCVCLVVVRGLLIGVPALVAEHRLCIGRVGFRPQ